jgi:YegS/Rv2252/BmrU family lipid kinase
MRTLVVGRRRKGRQVGAIIREVSRLLRAEGWEVDSAIVKRKVDLRRAAARAVKAHVDVVVAVGGDGSVGMVATALAETKVALGIVPTGTGNLLATNLGIPHPRDEAVKTILSGRHRRIDMGRVAVDGARHDFTVACGVGFDADVIQKTGTAEKRRLGKIAYLANVLGQMGGIENVPHEITLDGAYSTTDAAQVFIANFGGILPGLKPRRPIHPDDGVFDVVVVRASGPMPGLLAGWEALRQQETGESPEGHVFRAQAREVRIDTKPSRLVEIDGSIVGRTPITASIRPAALTVIVPADD